MNKGTLVTSDSHGDGKILSVYANDLYYVSFFNGTVAILSGKEIKRRLSPELLAAQGRNRELCI